MHDDGYLSRIRTSSIKRLNEHLRRVHEGEPLGSTHRFTLRNRDLVVRSAWRVTLLANGNKVSLIVFVDDNYPFSPPGVAVERPDEHFLKYPHVEHSGKLCLLGNHAATSHASVEAVADEILADAVRLLETSYRGENQADFTDEFTSYWSQSLPRDGEDAVSLLPVDTYTGRCSVLVLEGIVIFGIDTDQLVTWTKKCRRSIASTKQIVPGFVLRPDGLFVPNRYPHHFEDLLNLVDGDAKVQLRKTMTEVAIKRQSFYCLIVVEGNKGIGLGACSLSADRSILERGGLRNGKKRKNRRDMSKSGSTPGMYVTKFYERQKLRRHVAKRADTKWIIERTGMPNSHLLSMSVAIIGCGALGGDVALLLSKTGVGTILLVDKDTFAWENVGRHVLGGMWVGQNKAKALHCFLERELPHLTFASHATDWRNDDALASIRKCDCIVSLTGEWSSDAPLNALARKDLRFPPLVFGWSEAYGCAGHALAVLDVGGCLACGSDHLGRFDRHLAEFSSEKQILNGLPACGEFFAPHGYLETSSIKQMIAGLVVDVLSGKQKTSEHRVWIGSRELFESSAAHLREQASTCENYDKGHERILRQEWPVSSSCRLCA